GSAAAPPDPRGRRARRRRAARRSGCPRTRSDHTASAHLLLGPMIVCEAMSRTTVSPGAVRALFLARQHLLRPRALPLSAARLTRFVEAVGFVQPGSTIVVARSHDLTSCGSSRSVVRVAVDR